MPVELYDERFTTRLAERSGGRASEDSRAAAHLLESWLAAHGSGASVADGRERTAEEREAARLERERRRAAQAAPAPEPAELAPADAGAPIRPHRRPPTGPTAARRPGPTDARRGGATTWPPPVAPKPSFDGDGSEPVHPERRIRGRVGNAPRGLARADAGRAQAETPSAGAGVRRGPSRKVRVLAVLALVARRGADLVPDRAVPAVPRLRPRQRDGHDSGALELEQGRRHPGARRRDRLELLLRDPRDSRRATRASCARAPTTSSRT